MNIATSAPNLPDLTVDLLKKRGILVDNLLADLWKEIGMKHKLKRLGFAKRSGMSADQVVYCLMMWVWLSVDSVGMFARNSLKTFASGSKDALYAALNNEKWNWRKLHLAVARSAISKAGLKERTAAFVLDDTVVKRFGKKMPGISCHFDHTDGRFVMGQQVLTLGISGGEGFVPVDSELYTSKSQAQGRHEAAKDGRSVAAKRFDKAKDQTKPEMAADMIKRAVRAGILAAYLIADSWFGTKAMILAAEENDLVPVLRMKKNKMKYRLRELQPDGTFVYYDLSADELFQRCVRKQWQQMGGGILQKWKAKHIDVMLNLADKKDDKEKWGKVRLLFVQGVDLDTEQTGKHTWALFLTTDLSLDAQRMLEIYSMRWAIEVYFKEAKQHLGLLKEQSNHYAAYLASIHLTAIRFCMLVIAKADQSGRVADIRSSLCANLTNIDYAARLWGSFRAVISGALDEMQDELGDLAGRVMDKIDDSIQRLFVNILQIDTKTLAFENIESIS